MNEKTTWTRRIFVKEALRGWLGLVLAPTAYAIGRRFLSTQAASKKLPVSVGAVADFPLGESRIVLAGDEKVLVARGLDGHFHAVSAVCTHVGCSIRFEATATNPGFACNCHSSRFSLRGENISGPAPSPLERYDVRTEKGQIVVDQAQSL